MINKISILKQKSVPKFIMETNNSTNQLKNQIEVYLGSMPLGTVIDDLTTLYRYLGNRKDDGDMDDEKLKKLSAQIKENLGNESLKEKIDQVATKIELIKQEVTQDRSELIPLYRKIIKICLLNYDLDKSVAYFLEMKKEDYLGVTPKAVSSITSTLEKALIDDSCGILTCIERFSVSHEQKFRLFKEFLALSEGERVDAQVYYHLSRLFLNSDYNNALTYIIKAQELDTENQEYNLWKKHIQLRSPTQLNLIASSLKPRRNIL